MKFVVQEVELEQGLLQATSVCLCTGHYGGIGKSWSLRNFFIRRSAAKTDTNPKVYTGKRWSLGVSTKHDGGIGKQWSLRDFLISRSAEKADTNQHGVNKYSIQKSSN